MHTTRCAASSVSGRQAEALLQAWVRGDASELRDELERSIRIGSAVPNQGEEERLELLTSIASRMKEVAGLRGGADTEVAVCVNLLLHLASRPVYSA